MHTSVNDEMFAMMERYENNIVLISNYWQDKYYIRLNDSPDPPLYIFIECSLDSTIWY